MPHLQEHPGAAAGAARAAGAEAAALGSELRAVQASMRAEADALAGFREKAVALLKAADAVVRTFQRAKLWRDAPSQFRGQAVPGAVQELVAAPVLLPSPFLEQAAAGFAAQVAEFKKTVAELEQALAAQAAGDALGALGGFGGGGGPGGGGGSGGADGGGGSGVDAARALPTVVGNLHGYFTHVAAKLERAHGEVREGVGGWGARSAPGGGAGGRAAALRARRGMCARASRGVGEESRRPAMCDLTSLSSPPHTAPHCLPFPPLAAQLQAAKDALRAALRQQGVYRDPFERAHAAADAAAKARGARAPPLLPAGAGAAAGDGGGGGGGGAAAPGALSSAAGFNASPAVTGFGGGGGLGAAGFGSPFAGAPGAFGAQQGAAALGRTSSKNSRPSKSRR